MKKMSIVALAAALFIGGTAFVSCGGDDSSSPAPVTLKFITADTASAKTAFAVGEDFSAEGLEVRAVYSNNTKKTLAAEDYTVALAAANLGEDGKVCLSGTANSETATVTVSYEDKTTTYDVNISKAVNHITITADSTTKTKYNIGDAFDSTGITVKAFYSAEDSEGEDVTAKATFTATYVPSEGAEPVEFTTASAGTYTVTLTASYMGKEAKLENVEIKVIKPVTQDFEITFQKTNNTCTFDSETGFYTINAVDASSGEWQNQIFIKNPNALANIKAGDNIRSTVTVVSDKAISSFFFKNQFNSGTYSGLDTVKTLNKDEETTFEVIGVVADDYDDSSSFVIDLRGNDDDTTLTIKEIKTEILTDYEITSIKLNASNTTPAAGETVTLTAVDQYGFAITEGVTYAITSENPVSTISGNVLTAGASNETVTVTATYDGKTATVDITVSATKDYAKYWSYEKATQDGANAPADYFSIWVDHGWVGSTVALSNMSATENSVSLTQAVTGTCWHGTQIWYGVSAASNMTFKVTSSVAGDITVNGTVYTLEANVEKDISLEGVTGKLAIQLGNETAVTQLGDCTFSITEFTVTPVAAAE